MCNVRFIWLIDRADLCVLTAFSGFLGLPQLWLASSRVPLTRLLLAATVVLVLGFLPGDDRGVFCGLPDIHFDMESLTEFNWKDMIR